MERSISGAVVKVEKFELNDFILVFESQILIL